MRLTRSLLSCSLLAVLSILCLSSCSRREPLATAASSEDFRGQWKGTWSWSSSTSTTLEISDGRFTARGLPVQDASGQMRTVSTQGEAVFEREYGASGRPCVLLHLDDPKVAVDVYLYKDKKRLLYVFDVNLDQEIIFARQ